MIEEGPAQHPLPWKQGPGGYMKLGVEGPAEISEDDGRLITLTVGNCMNNMDRGEVAALYRRLGDILLAPFRVIVTGGDAVPAGLLDTIGPWFDTLKTSINRRGWRVQVVYANANPAQAAVGAWCAERDVQLLTQSTLDLSIGGSIVALLPCKNALDVNRHARQGYGMSVYRVAPDSLWTKPKSVAAASGGGFTSKPVDFEMVDEAG